MTIRSSLLLAAGVRHGFSTRPGGGSTAYLSGEKAAGAGELNLGFTASDTREHVLGNRERLLRGLFGSVLPLVTLRQTHSAASRQVTAADAGEAATLEGDGLITDEAHIALGIQTADCVPVLVADRRRGVIAAFHAGWRGTLARIVEDGVGTLRAEYGSEPGDLVAAIGPCIRQCCYGVGEEVVAAFHSRFAYAGMLFSDPPPATLLPDQEEGERRAVRLDLAAANRQQLLDAGLGAEGIEDVGLCTACRTDLFFSYRAEKGFTGRMLSVIARV